MKKLKEKIQSAVNIYQSGNLLKAEKIVKNLIKTNSRVAFLQNLLGLILSDQNKFEEAMRSYQTGIKIDPRFSEIYNNMGMLVFKSENINKYNLAEEYYKKSILLNDKKPEPYNNLGNLYNSVDDYDKAILNYKKAIDVNANFFYAHHNLAQVYIAVGNIENARKHLNESIRLNKDFFYAHRSLSRITKYNTNNEHLAKLSQIYKETDPKDENRRIEISFALGKAYEDIKDFKKSFALYKVANSLYRKRINFSIRKQKKYFSEIKKSFNKKVLENYIEDSCIDSSAIFIVGMPRSGTTLVEQILSSHVKVFGADEIEFLPELLKKNIKENNLKNLNNKTTKYIGEEYISKIKKISNKSEKVTDKLPTNFLSVGFIKLILPKSKIIHCYRNPRDNCFSLFKNHFASGKVNFSYKLEEIIQYYKLYEDLMKFWNNLIPNFIFNIKYENLISNTRSEIKKMLNYCLMINKLNIAYLTVRYKMKTFTSIKVIIIFFMFRIKITNV